MRAFIGFLMQDEAGLAVTVSGMTPNLIKRFIARRSGAHSYAVPWKGKHYNHTSKGIKGESIQRNIEEIRAEFTHAANNGRIPYVPKVHYVPKEKRGAMILQRCGFLLRRTNDPRRNTNPRPTKYRRATGQEKTPQY